MSDKPRRKPSAVELTSKKSEILRMRFKTLTGNGGKSPFITPGLVLTMIPCAYFAAQLRARSARCSTASTP